jgi:hypothetical protein
MFSALSEHDPNGIQLEPARSCFRDLARVDSYLNGNRLLCLDANSCIAGLLYASCASGVSLCGRAFPCPRVR